MTTAYRSSIHPVLQSELQACLQYRAIKFSGTLPYLTVTGISRHIWMIAQDEDHLDAVNPRCKLPVVVAKGPTPPWAQISYDGICYVICACTEYVSCQIMW